MDEDNARQLLTQRLTAIYFGMFVAAQHTAGTPDECWQSATATAAYAARRLMEANPDVASTQADAPLRLL